MAAPSGGRLERSNRFLAPAGRGVPRRCSLDRIVIVTGVRGIKFSNGEAAPSAVALGAARYIYRHHQLTPPQLMRFVGSCGKHCSRLSLFRIQQPPTNCIRSRATSSRPAQTKKAPRCYPEGLRERSSMSRFLRTRIHSARQVPTPCFASIRASNEFDGCGEIRMPLHEI